jgi:uncharacterized membrane protein YdbT with pleckstrin-like domain
MEDIDAVMNGDETILWQGRPALLPFFAGAIVSSLLGVGLLAILVRVVGEQQAGQHADLAATVLFLSPWLLVSFLLAVVYPIWRLLVYLRMSYAITSQRVVLQSGVIEHDVAMVDFDQIVHADAEVNWTDILSL